MIVCMCVWDWLVVFGGRVRRLVDVMEEGVGKYMGEGWGKGLCVYLWIFISVFRWV